MERGWQEDGVSQPLLFLFRVQLGKCPDSVPSQKVQCSGAG